MDPRAGEVDGQMLMRSQPAKNYATLASEVQENADCVVLTDTTNEVPQYGWSTTKQMQKPRTSPDLCGV